MQREAEIWKRLRRRAFRLYRARTLLALIGFFALFVLAPLAVVFVFIPTQTLLGSPVLADVVLADEIGFIVLLAVASIGSAWLRSQGGRNLDERIEQAVEVIARLRRLRAEHPELVELDEVQGFLNDEKAQLEGRRSFWVGLLVNLGFTLLGFGLSYVATKLGWLR